MRKQFIILSILLCLCFGLCLQSCDDNKSNDPALSYNAGYNAGYEAGQDSMFDAVYDEVKYERNQKNALFCQVFNSLGTDVHLSDGDLWEAGRVSLKLYVQGEYLYWEFKISGFNLKEICQNSDVYFENFPIKCYVGTYDRDGYLDWTPTNFLGENGFVNEIFQFTIDGFLIDYESLRFYSETTHLMIFIDGKVYTATYNLSL